MPGSERWPQNIFREARTQILLWYAGLFLLLGSLAIPAFRWVLFQRIDERVRGDLLEQMTGFQAHQQENNLGDIPALISDFILTTLPEDENYFIFFLGNRFYTSSPKALPVEIQPETRLVQFLAAQREAIQGEQVSDNPAIQNLIYVVEPIRSVQGQVVGTFIGIHTTAGERQEAIEGTIVFAEVLAGTIAIAFFLSWWISGWVLAPVRSLTATAQEISEEDLERRLIVGGRGEMATLALTFNAMLDRLQALIVSQRNFISDASHELRTPITIVRGHLELMGDDPEEQQEAIAIAMDELDRLECMVEEMSLLAKAQRPDFVRPGVISLSEFMSGLGTKAKLLGERQWCLELGREALVRIDAQRLTEAMLNLIQNAIEHTQPGDTIAIGSLVSDRSVMFWVRDTGIGIAPEHQQRIFQRFVRIGKSTSHARGAGLGLPIVQAIAEAHGGSVAVQSQLGVGSTFTITIPYACETPSRARRAGSERNR
ncbi:MAG: HAMP domain-containing histidine kinase [Chloroflexaceae bacterium]|nr:HAMP domain-containing histidine kinase [Chloroflexaceae bacterium]